MAQRSRAGGRLRRLPLRSFSAFLFWGVALSALQALLEPTVVLKAPTAWLVRGIEWSLPVLGVSTSVDGSRLAFLGTSQEITPNCLGLVVVAAYAAAVLGTPAPWPSRGRALVLGLVAISAVNAARLLASGAVLTASVAAFHFSHIAVWGALAPLFVLGIWGLWAVRDVGLLPAYPVRLLARVAVGLPILLVAWPLGRDTYLSLVTVAVNAVLGAAGAAVRRASLVQVEQYRYLDIALDAGGVRFEVASVAVTLVAFLALVAATPAPMGRRLRVAMGGVAVLFALQVAGAAGVVLLGLHAPGVALPLETFVDFLGLTAPLVLWLSAFGLLLNRSLAPVSPRLARHERRAMDPAAVPAAREKTPGKGAKRGAATPRQIAR